MIIAIIMLSILAITLGVKCFGYWAGNCALLTYMQQKGYKLPNDAEVEISKAFVIKNIITDLTVKKL